MQELDNPSHTDIRSREEPGDILLFHTDTSVLAVSTSTKVHILKLAKEGPVSEDAIVIQTGKARSTITKHLRDLEKAGLIRTSINPKDKRRRIVMLSSEKIGHLTTSDWNVPPAPSIASDAAAALACNDITSFFRFAMITFRTQAMTMGIDLSPLMRQTGIQLGAGLAPVLAAKTVEGLIQNMAAFWKKYGLGTVALSSKTPLVIELRGCFECSDMPLTGRCVCAFDTGVLSALFSNHLKCPVSVIEEECYSKGDGRCLFVIRPVQG